MCCCCLASAAGQALLLAIALLSALLCHEPTSGQRRAPHRPPAPHLSHRSCPATAHPGCICAARGWNQAEKVDLRKEKLDSRRKELDSASTSRGELRPPHLHGYSSHAPFWREPGGKRSAPARAADSAAGVSPERLRTMRAESSLEVGARAKQPVD
ncbi:unnamed protein product [Urochloa humidicola]